jgi:DNA-binding PadR family transcriptional regulator
LLEDRPRHGYEILHDLADASEGWRPSPGTIYPILHDLHEHGLITKMVEEKEGRRRIVYKLRAKGKADLETAALEHGRFVAIMRRLLGKHGGPRFPGSPAFNVDKALRRMQHVDVFLAEVQLLPDEIASDIEQAITLLQQRQQLLEKHETQVQKAIRQVKKQIQNLKKKTPVPTSK